MSGDRIGFNDVLEATLSTAVIAPLHPCPHCAIETKDSGTLGWRCCTDCNQRVYVGLTEQQHHVLLGEISASRARVEQITVMYKAADSELSVALRTLRDRGII